MIARAVALAALIGAAWALWVLEGARAGIVVSHDRIGQTPVTRYVNDGPPVLIAHGFAGSRQMMQGYALTLARAGYDVTAFDFLGHGRNPVPMSGDVTATDGTTELLVTQTLSVLEALPNGAPVALLGHSMATDILVRVAARSDRTGPVVLLSAFSLAITAEHPQNLLLITGAWEPGLRGFAHDALRVVDPDVAEASTVQQGDVTRRAVIAPAAEHVAILHSRTGRAEARAWLDRFYGRAGPTGTPAPTGWAILALLAAVTALSAPAMRLIPVRATAPPPLPARRFWTAVLLPSLAAPLIAAPVDTRFLPVLVADYLALHLALFGAIQMALLWRDRRPGPVDARATLLVLAWTIGLFGLALDRYAANFLPTPGRLAIIAALSLGAVPFMLADALVSHGESLARRVAARAGFLASLGIAVALDFRGLFFLLMIGPVIVLFYLTMGLMGRFAAARAGPTGPGLALGLALAWALGVSFPLFAAWDMTGP